VIAIWTYIDHARVTQFLQDGTQAPNLLDPTLPLSAQLNPATAAAADHVQIATPRSMQTDQEFTTPDGHRVALPDDDFGSYVIIPSTFTDYNEWVQTRAGSFFKERNNASPPLVDPTQASFHSETRMKDGTPVILIDPGSVGNLGGSKWAKEVARRAMQAGRKPEQHKRDRPLNVSGVGNGSQHCDFNVVLPIAFERLDSTFGRGTFELPVVPDSELPGLLGLQSMRDRRTILDLNTMQMHLLGPGDYDLLTILPPGSESYQCLTAPSGHMVLPCCAYDGVDRSERGRLDTGPDLALPVRALTPS